ncbi:DUF2155 domain-containing protein [Asaia krungthepensis]|uniref:DUF2155 domain-containing protein n=1 Tax=Asaia krungthepensis NRIC 0535 TaxID=1307925 RepID=A0ABQ0Q461_9PROT|nr:DUF2155 domain-containing protein [Asaia krungthepensis]GBQ90517.1 hypothetical protein AA0535_2066 [Asaia krungthepensis NRIC 0535]
MMRAFSIPCALGALLLGLSPLSCAVAAEAIAPPVMYPADLWQGRGEAVIRVLNRTDSHVETMTVPVGGQAQYRSLHLGVARCVERPETLPRDAAALISTSDDTDPGAHYQGWILAEEPSLSTYKSALYDIAIVSCSGPKADPALAPLPQAVVPVLSNATPEGADNQPGDLDDPSHTPASPGRTESQSGTLPAVPPGAGAAAGGPTRLTPLGDPGYPTQPSGTASSQTRPVTPSYGTRSTAQPPIGQTPTGQPASGSPADTGGPMQLAPLSGGDPSQALPPPQPYNH